MFIGIAHSHLHSAARFDSAAPDLREESFDLGCLVNCADDAEIRRRARPRGAGPACIATRPGELPELALDLSVEKTVLRSLSLKAGNAKRCQSLAELPPLSLDSRAAGQCLGRCDAITAPLRAVERSIAEFGRHFEIAGPQPHLSEIESDHLLDDGVRATLRNREPPLKAPPRL